MKSKTMPKLFRHWLLKPVLSVLNHMQRTIAMNQQELIDALNGVNEAVGKVGTETTALLAEVQALKDAIEAGTVTPEVEAALAAVVARVKAVDDLVPDAPAPDPAP
jgi:hypothetical protein